MRRFRDFPGVLRVARPERSLYRAVWRWHFYAGLFAIPVIVILCLSGIVYLFKPQLNHIMYGEMMKVTPGQTAVSYEQQKTAVLDRYPGAEIGQILTPDKPNRSTQFDITTSGGKSYAAWVNPYTGEVLGHRNNDTDPVALAKLVHGTLLTGKFLGDDGKYGDRVVELVAGWSVVLVITGLYLWWPRGRTGRWWSSLTVRRFSATSTLGDIAPNGASPWAASKLPMIASQIPVAGGPQVTWAPGTPAPLDAIVATAQAQGFDGSVVVTPPSDAKGSYFVGSYEDTDAAPNRSSFDQRILYVDQYSATPIVDYSYGDYGLTGKALSTGIALHEGREWGLVSQIGALIGTLAILLSVASSLVMWRRRRPKGLGSPRRESQRRVGVGVLGIMAVLGFVFPLVGLSMVVLLMIEFVLLRRIPPVARALGLVDARPQEREKV